MSKLHEQFLHIDGPTDVLTFEIDRSIKGRIISGEIIVCLPCRAAKPRQRKFPCRMNCLRRRAATASADTMSATRGDYEKMHREEDRIFEETIESGRRLCPCAQTIKLLINGENPRITGRLPFPDHGIAVPSAEVVRSADAAAAAFKATMMCVVKALVYAGGRAKRDL